MVCCVVTYEFVVIANVIFFCEWIKGAFLYLYTHGSCYFKHFFLGNKRSGKMRCILEHVFMEKHMVLAHVPYHALVTHVTLCPPTEQHVHYTYLNL